MTLSRRADMALVFNTIIWGSTFVLVKEALADCSVILFLALRFTLATSALAILFRRDLKWSRRDLWGGILAGFFLIAGYLLQTAGLLTTTASKSGFLTGLYVVLIPLFGSIVYKSAPGWREWTGVLLATAGMALMTLENLQFQMSRGDALTLGCAVAFAFHPLTVGWFAGGETKVLSLVQIATAALASWLLLPNMETSFVHWSPRLVTAIAITGLLATALAFSLQTWAQRYTTPTRLAVIFAMEPVVAVLTGVLFAGERLAPRAWAGAVLILAGILRVEMKPAPSPVHPSA